METKGESEECWCVECSDEEMNEKGAWEPETSEIVILYNKLKKGEVLELEWKCPGRMSCSPEIQDEDSTQTQHQTEEVSKEEEKVAPTEFDWSEPTEAHVVTPRRTPGSSRTPRRAKPVAQLDKIMKDMHRHKRLNQVASSSKTSPGTPRVKSGSPHANKQKISFASNATQLKVTCSPGSTSPISSADNVTAQNIAAQPGTSLSPKAAPIHTLSISSTPPQQNPQATTTHTTQSVTEENITDVNISTTQIASVALTPSTATATVDRHSPISAPPISASPTSIRVSPAAQTSPRIDTETDQATDSTPQRGSPKMRMSPRKLNS